MCVCVCVCVCVCEAVVVLVALLEDHKHDKTEWNRIEESRIDGGITLTDTTRIWGTCDVAKSCIL